MEVPVYNDRPTPKAPVVGAPGIRSTVRLLRIPDNGKHLEIIDVPLLRIGRDATKGIGYYELERDLGHIPDLWSQYVKVFPKLDLSLVAIPAVKLDKLDKQENPDYSRKEDYYMYKCRSRRAGPIANAFFQGVPGASVYGDAFVFKVEPDSFEIERDTSSFQLDASGKQPVETHMELAIYVDMDDAFERSVSDRKGAYELVKKLASL